jgi:diacylglycerol kinase (ATP)
MKNQPLLKRIEHAWDGIVAAFNSESSFHLQTLIGLGVMIFLLAVRPSAIWWALISITIGGVLATELINTALEALIDLLYPDQHPTIKLVKDCMAAAVLVFSLVAVAVFIAFLCQMFFR